jgi:Tol biopolymer transport system component
MPLPVGTRLGVYEILGPLGAGGMGEVYRARDSRLAREVAIKQLAPALAQDPEYLARFEREAQVLAALNHPNIAAIYGLEGSAIVMELIPGETLADQIARGPIPLDTALPILRQIAEALEAAHEKGIVHRDLKPANVKITPDGGVKVLDFGLAKTPEPAAQSVAANSPTLTLRATQAGVIMGTAGYMSPEQAAGKPVDKRADIWSFGVVLWETLTGAPLFQGETISHTLADVLRSEIDTTRLPAGAIRDLAARCLDRNLKTRLRDIGEARIAIDRHLASPAPAVPGARPSRFPWIVAAAAVVLAAGALWRRPASATLPTHATAFLVHPPEKEHFHTVRLSPDGKWLALEVDRGGGTMDTYLAIRAIDSPALRVIAQTDAVGNHFWSPDSRSIAFFTSSKLKKIDLDGSGAATICDLPGNGAFGSWSRQGTILAVSGGKIYHVPATGGVPVEAPVASNEGRRRPHFLPDGEHYLYMTQPTGAAPELRVGSLRESRSESLVPNTPFGVFAPLASGAARGHLLFLRGNALAAQSFDAAARKLSGEPTLIAEDISAATGGTARTPSVSDLGAVAYGTEGNETVLGSIGADGVVALGQPRSYREVAVSPDGRRAVVAIATPAGPSDLWVIDLERKSESRLTFSPEGGFLAPVWSPDGSRVVYASTRDDAPGLYEIAANGASEEKLLMRAGRHSAPHGFSPDGRYLVYASEDPQTKADLWLLPMTGDRTPRPFLQTPFAESHGQVSPDGRFLAYQSNEAGHFEVYVRTFPDPSGGKWRVSRGRAGQPRWSRDGKKILYLNGGRTVTEVPVQTRAGFQSGEPKETFVAALPGSYTGVPGFFYGYAPAAAPDRLIAVLSAESNAPITVVENWRAKLPR